MPRRDAAGREVVPVPGLGRSKPAPYVSDPNHKWKGLGVQNHGTFPPSDLRRCEVCGLIEQVTPGTGDHSGDDSEPCETCGRSAGERPWLPCPKPKTVGPPRITVMEVGTDACYR